MENPRNEHSNKEEELDHQGNIVELIVDYTKWLPFANVICKLILS